MEAVRNSLAALTGNTIGLILMATFMVGPIYWIWMAIQFGSFGMFLFGVIPPFVIIAAPLGLWSLLFGPPQWLLALVF
jgi:hypothetical protein